MAATDESDGLATDRFDYDLPPECIAQTPVEPRDRARMLVSLDPDAPPQHRSVGELDQLLRPGDLLVVNDTKVLAARLNLHKPTGGAVEVLLLEPTGEHLRWQALVRPGKRVAPGTVLSHQGRPLVTVGERLSDGRRLVEVDPEAMALAGQVPLPPYITETLDEPDRYQTVYARNPGSVAAPTAGLHLTDALLDRLADRGIELARVELRVGLGTFRPITAEVVTDHEMHAERYAIAPETWERIQRAERVVAVGTTVVRTLESAAATGQLSGETSLFIRPGFDWKVVDVLMTNFHVPRSSLLVMIDAFVGERWRDLYRTAVDHQYRFLSFGDAMLLGRQVVADAAPPVGTPA